MSERLLIIGWIGCLHYITHSDLPIAPLTHLPIPPYTCWTRERLMSYHLTPTNSKPLQESMPFVLRCALYICRLSPSIPRVHPELYTEYSVQAVTATGKLLKPLFSTVCSLCKYLYRSPTRSAPNKKPPPHPDPKAARLFSRTGTSVSV